MSHLLFEIGSEELPSGAVLPLAQALANNLKEQLLDANLSYGSIQYYATPRRLAVSIEGLVDKQAPQQITRRGPASTASHDSSGDPTPALIGFARSCGVEVTELATTKTDKGEWWVYETMQAGSLTHELLPDIIKKAVERLPIAKPMRWGSDMTEFARPVHWAVLLYNDALVSMQILGINTGRFTRGHRFHAPQWLEIIDSLQYVNTLREHFVIADFNERRALIQKQVEKLAQNQALHAIIPDALLDEVTSIVEWPQALLASFDSAFLDVPAEALIAAMQVHQKGFALSDAENKLSPYFITVTNIESENAKQVVLGNEKVMHARLSDARFFYHQDKKTPLFGYLPLTENVVFQAKLGSLGDKARRLQSLIQHMVEPLNLEETSAMRAAVLSKCDLLTGMVGEFPELQGVMGSYYATNDGETSAVAKALAEQYMPRFAGDELPQSNLGLALSLVDRLDTLVGIFAIGQKPTGVKDPFKLRRHALAIVRMLSQISTPLRLSILINQALKNYGDELPSTPDLESLRVFILERLLSYYQSQGLSADVVHAVRAVEEDWLFDVGRRIYALRDFIQTPDAQALSAACKRVNNILNQSNVAPSVDIEEAKLTDAAEKSLLTQIKQVEQDNLVDYRNGEYLNILTRLANLRQPIDLFFEEVMVMVEDIQIVQNRLALLKRLHATLSGVADIGLLTKV